MKRITTIAFVFALALNINFAAANNATFASRAACALQGAFQSTKNFTLNNGSRAINFAKDLSGKSKSILLNNPKKSFVVSVLGAYSIAEYAWYKKYGNTFFAGKVWNKAKAFASDANDWVVENIKTWLKIKTNDNLDNYLTKQEAANTYVTTATLTDQKNPYIKLNALETLGKKAQVMEEWVKKADAKIFPKDENKQEDSDLNEQN